ncbi:MAG: hypothetical protein D6731_23200, partial [Planctomycetota bacterium]
MRAPAGEAAHGDPPQRSIVGPKEVALDDALRAFCFAEKKGFVVPAEFLGPEGLAPGFAALLRAERGLSAEWVAAFDAAFALAWRRQEELFRRAPGHWFPPRCNNVVVWTEADAAHPYLRPLSRSGWAFYADDFEPARSSRELAAFLFVQAERLNAVGEVGRSLLANLSYFLAEGVDLADFRAGAARSRRPDAPLYRALAEALDWIPRLGHVALRPLSAGEPAEPLGRHAESGLLV